jgi:hypothetical protein
MLRLALFFLLLEDVVSVKGGYDLLGKVKLTNVSPLIDNMEKTVDNLKITLSSAPLALSFMFPPTPSNHCQPSAASGCRSCLKYVQNLSSGVSVSSARLRFHRTDSPPCESLDFLTAEESHVGGGISHPGQSHGNS